MPITNAQYDEIMRRYDAKQLNNKRSSEKKIKEAYIKVPRLKEIDDAIASTSVASARQLLAGDSSAISELKQKLAAFRQERINLLKEYNFPENYFEPDYTCKDCKDTGFINGKQCHCFKQEVIDVVYSQSNIKKILSKENFSNFSLSYYSEDIIDPTTNLSAHALAEHAYENSIDFVKNFESSASNILFFGDTGVGKTFLSNCIAKALLDSGHSVIYFTSFQLFEVLSKGVFSRDSEAIAANKSIFDCDLLIIDDLGTELTNAFTNSQLFLCVNERLLRQKSTIISTNLGMRQILDTYSERTFSRISNNYSIFKLVGDDIRMKKRGQV